MGVALAVNGSPQNASTIFVLNHDGSVSTKFTFAAAVTANAVSGPIAITTPGGVAVSQGSFTVQ